MGFTSNGVAYPQAYIQVSYHKLNSKETVLQLLAWTSEDARHSGASPLPWYDNVAEFVTTDLTEANPIAYAYAQLEASGEFPDAIWNV